MLWIFLRKAGTLPSGPLSAVSAARSSSSFLQLGHLVGDRLGLEVREASELAG